MFPIDLPILAATLEKNSVVTHLILSQNGLDDKMVASLFHSLYHKQSRLQVLWLDGNALGKSGVHNVLECCQKIPTLYELNVADNNIG